MKIVVISKTKLEQEEALLITSLFEAGLQHYHIRKPSISTQQMARFIRQIPAKYHNRIIIHSHHQLALAFDLKGIHITRMHRQKGLSYKLFLKYLVFRKPQLIFTSSCTSLGNILDKSMSKRYDYVFLSPVFDSLNSKYQGGYNDFSLKSALTTCGKSIIARGGVDIDRIEKANEIGFKGVAFQSYLWSQENPLQAFVNILQRVKEKELVAE